MMKKHRLNKTLILFYGFLSATIVWADNPDIATSVKVKPLSSLHSTLVSDKTPLPLATDPQAKEIVKGVQQSLQNFTQLRTNKKQSR